MGTLTETQIKGLEEKTRGDRWVGDGDGLYLRLLDTGRRSWVWRKKKNGATSYIVLGQWSPEAPGHMSVKQARVELAKRTGRRIAPNALTVADALREWYADSIEPRYRNSECIRVYVRKSVAEFGTRRLTELTQTEIARFVKDYGKRSPVAANRCLGALRLALNWCCTMGYLEHNPAANVTKAVAGGVEKSRDRVLSDQELKAIWRMEGPVGNMMRGLLLSGARSRELQRATRAHLDGDWLHIPPSNSKNKRAHRIYVTPKLREQFDGTGDNLFKAVHRVAVQKAVRVMQTDPQGNLKEPWASLRPINRETRAPDERAFVPHDARRTMSTRMNELGIAPPHIIEKILNHAAAGIAAVYNRAELLDERAAATRAWAAEVSRLTG